VKCQCPSTAEGASGRGHHGKHETITAVWGLWAEPTAWSRGRAHSQWVRGAKPPEDESFEAFVCVKEGPKLVAKMQIPFKYLAIHLLWTRCQKEWLPKIVSKNCLTAR